MSLALRSRIPAETASANSIDSAMRAVPVTVTGVSGKLQIQAFLPGFIQKCGLCTAKRGAVQVHGSAKASA
ncbi:hypothetical protein BA177_03030 [Woeseia oceani]|uniref:Uncharacterized protein n=1 Tax=Woeseia oceani TaxID=1548547 RepID=A0A193LD63_9GAMM|nr:hypothetical protein BA177_03030 [Woeseia oceani]